MYGISWYLAHNKSNCVSYFGPDWIETLEYLGKVGCPDMAGYNELLNSPRALNILDP